MNLMEMRADSGGGEGSHIPRIGTRAAVITTETRDLATTITIYTTMSIMTFAGASVTTWGSIAMATSTTLIAKNVRSGRSQFIL